MVTTRSADKRQSQTEDLVLRSRNIPSSPLTLTPSRTLRKRLSSSQADVESPASSRKRVKKITSLSTDGDEDTTEDDAKGLLQSEDALDLSALTAEKHGHTLWSEEASNTKRSNPDETINAVKSGTLDRRRHPDPDGTSLVVNQSDIRSQPNSVGRKHHHFDESEVVEEIRASKGQDQPHSIPNAREIPDTEEEDSDAAPEVISTKPIFHSLPPPTQAKSGKPSRTTEKQYANLNIDGSNPSHSPAATQTHMLDDQQPEREPEPHPVDTDLFKEHSLISGNTPHSLRLTLPGPSKPIVQKTARRPDQHSIPLPAKSSSTVTHYRKRLYDVKRNRHPGMSLQNDWAGKRRNFVLL